MSTNNRKEVSSRSRRQETDAISTGNKGGSSGPCVATNSCSRREKTILQKRRGPVAAAVQRAQRSSSPTRSGNNAIHRMRDLLSMSDHPQREYAHRPHDQQQQEKKRWAAQAAEGASCCWGLMEIRTERPVYYKSGTRRPDRAKTAVIQPAQPLSPASHWKPPRHIGRQERGLGARDY